MEKKIQIPIIRLLSFLKGKLVSEKCCHHWKVGMLSTSSGCILQQIKGQFGSARTKVGPVLWNKEVTGRAANRPSDNQLAGTTEQPSIIAWVSSLKHLYRRHKSKSCLQFILHPSAALRACSWGCSPFNEKCSRAVIPTGFPVETEMTPSVIVHCPVRGA